LISLAGYASQARERREKVVADMSEPDIVVHIELSIFAVLSLLRPVDAGRILR